MNLADSLIGTTVGNYTLTARIGSGGMGDVYEGVHPTIGARVAIKVLQTTPASDPDGARRFLLEARVGNKVEHPGVLQAIDAGQLADGRPYLVMPLLEGQSLAARLAVEPRLRIDEACRIAVDMLDALDAAHARGIVHRDLKPPNVFLTRTGRVVVLDFGVAKMIGDARLTMTGATVGTPYYMAPEQIRQKTVGPPTDVYAAGIVLFEMVCGRLPFDSDSTFEVMGGQLDKRPPPPKALRPDLPVPIQDVILQALAKPMDKRFATAGAMRDALCAVLGLRPSAQRLAARAPSGEHAAIPGPTPVVQPPPPQKALAKTVIASPRARGERRGAGRVGRAVPWVALVVLAIVAAIVVAVIAMSGGGSDAGTPDATRATPVVATTDAAVQIAVPIADATPTVMPPDAGKRRARRDAADNPAMGGLDVTTEPTGALVQIDGVRRGVTPHREALSPGDHEVVLSLVGYETKRLVIQVVADKTVKLQIGLAEDLE